MSEYVRTCLILCPLIFFGAFVDSIAGGGGVITLPAYLLAGFPPHMAAGTNKLIATCGGVISAGKYIKSGYVDFKIAAFSIVGALLGGILGSNLALVLSERYLKLIMLIALPCVAVYLLFKRNFGQPAQRKVSSPAATAAVSFSIGLLCGTYDGLIGPGAGTFLLLGFTVFLGTELITAAGCARVSNLASGITSLTVFIMSGNVNYSILLPVGACSMLGNWAGARFAIKNGSKNIKKVMMFVLVLIFVKIAYDFIG